MRVKGYSKEEAVNWTLQQLVHPEVTPFSSSVTFFFSSHLLLHHPISSPVVTPLVCSCHPCLSSCLPPPLVSHSHHRLTTIALRYSSVGRRHQTNASRLLPKLSPRHLLSAAVISSCLSPFHSLMADCQVIMCKPPLTNHPFCLPPKLSLCRLLSAAIVSLLALPRRAIIRCSSSVIVDCSGALAMMGPCPSFSWYNGK
jgi:hypothetical protein